MEHLYCVHCGIKVNDDSDYCPGCGAFQPETISSIEIPEELPW